MGRVDDQDALQARFERNAPSVDARRDWVELRSRMHEHDRRPAGRRLRLLAVACSVLVLVAAVTVGGIEAFAHLGKPGQTIIIGGETTSASTSPVTTTKITMDLAPADQISLSEEWLKIEKAAGFDAQNAEPEALELDFAPSGALHIDARMADGAEISIGWDGYGGAADQTVHVTGTLTSPTSHETVDTPLPQETVRTILFAIDAVGAKAMMDLTGVQAGGYLRLVPYVASGAQPEEIPSTETAYLWDGSSFNTLSPTDGKRKADPGYVRLAATAMVPQSAGDPASSLVAKTQVGLVIPANASWTTTTSTTPAADNMTISVYFTRDEKMAAAHRVIPKTQQTGQAAMQALLEGPTAAESAAGLVGAIPEGTRFLGLSITNGVATVNLSKEYESGGGSLSMSMRLAQVVYTLTQFPTVTKVNFQLEGVPVSVFGGEGIVLDHPVGRADYEDMAPAILVESPTVGDTASSPLHITGSANTFEATFIADVLDSSGAVIGEKVVTATSGSGTRGTFDVAVPYTVGQAGDGTLVVFEESAKDGSHINVVEIPLKLQK